eukprot:TRINITY_DN634_c0_g2_i1.p1 TRINITY_DN634_c0_g2~~TRINITY_DN634_c0_g2_i1.p1  ORF type:complete len:343 (+),score=32.11 TRINITY_DN634_c0_g2_i1:88-1116(+)
MSSNSSTSSSCDVSPATMISPRMVTVFDPVNKKPYQLVYGGAGGDVTLTAGLEIYLNQVGGNKRVFLCKKYQARQCRAQGKCNSIHADRKKIGSLRRENPVTPEAKLSEKTVEIYSESDQEKFSVPLDRLQPTKGLSDGSTTLCMTQGCSDVACLCIHVDSSYLRHLRNMWKMPCCGKTTCTGSPVPTYPTIQGRSWSSFKICDGGRGAAWNQSLLAPTKGLQDICNLAVEMGSFKDGVLAIPMNRVCRPHQRKTCKWDSGCNNVHICRVKMPPGNTRVQKKAQFQPPTLLPPTEMVLNTPSPLSPLLEKFRSTYLKPDCSGVAASPLGFSTSFLGQLVECV